MDDAVIEEFLQHYGKKGMKWGVRKSRTRVKAGGKTTNRTHYKKPPVKLSDQELTKRIKRLELEKRYKDLNAPEKSSGTKYIHGLLESSGKTATGAIVGGVVTFAVQRALKKKFGGS